MRACQVEERRLRARAPVVVFLSSTPAKRSFCPDNIAFVVPQSDVIEGVRV